MAITDLTGTTWVFNDTPTTAYNKLYNINFTSNNEKKSLLFVSGIIGYGSSTDNYGKYKIAYMPNSSVSVPFFANVNNFLLYYTETDNINWNSIQLTYSADKKANILSNYQYISLKPNTRYVLCPYRSTAEWLAGPTTGSHANGSDSNFLRISKFSTSTFSMSNFLSNIKYPNYTSNLAPVASAYPVVSDNTDSYATAYTTPSAGFTVAAFNTITITGGTDATNSELISWLQANATLQLPVSFKRYYKFPVLLGAGAYKFQPYTVAQPKLATVSGVSVTEKNLSFEAVKNAAEYEVLLDGVSVGTVENIINYTLSWSWACTVFINDTQVSTGSGSSTTIKAGDKIKVTTSGSNYISTSFPDIPVNPFVDGTYTFPAQDISLGTISNPRVSKAQNITMILT